MKQADAVCALATRIMIKPQASDAAAHFEVSPEFDPVAQRNDTYREPLAQWRKVDGLTRRGYAPMNDIRRLDWVAGKPPLVSARRQGRCYGDTPSPD
jgi:hypothetical protein